MAGPADAVRENQEKIALAGYLVIITVLAALLAPVLGQAWQDGGLPRLLFRVLAAFGFGLGPASSLILGVFLGSLLLMIYDTKKRLQGVLLLGGSLVGMLVLATQGLLLANIDFAATLEWLGLGLLVGLLVGGGRQLVPTNDTRTVELRNASRVVFLMLTTIVVVGTIEHHIQYPLPVAVSPGGQFRLTGASQPFGVRGSATDIALNLILAGLFVGTTKRFVQYDAERDFFVLGPKASGKSLLLVGAFLDAQERFSGGEDAAMPLNPSSDLVSLVGKLDQQRDGWFLEATRTQEIKTLQFRYVYGDIFPINVQLTGIDYAGEWLVELPDALLGARDNPPATLERLAETVRRADTLIFLIDCDRYANDESIGIEPYFEIIQAQDETDVVLVATKADVLAEQFREERGINAEQYFDDFVEFVNARLKNNQTIQALVAESAGSRIHPVYYQTRVNEDDERVPMRSDGDVATVGFDRLLERLGERR